MALRTMGTAATTTLSAVLWSQDPAVLSRADVALMVAGIKDDRTTGRPVAQISGVGGIEQGSGKLWVPNRGSLMIYPGDYIAFDPATGGVILVTAAAAAGASWVHT